MTYHRRLFNYDIELIPTDNKRIHLYYAKEKVKGSNQHTCFFARAVIRGGDDAFGTHNIIDFVISEAESVLMSSCNAIEVALGICFDLF